MADITINEMQGELSNFEKYLLGSTLDSINQSKENLEHEIINLVRDYSINNIYYLDKDTFDYEIREIVDKYFDLLRKFEEQQVQKTSNSLRKLTGSIIRLSSKKKIDKLESIFAFLSNNLVRKKNSKVYNNLNKQSINNIVFYITDKFLYTPSVADATNKFRDDLQEVFNKYSEYLVKKYRYNLNFYLNSYKGHFLESIKSKISSEMTQEKIDHQKLDNTTGYDNIDDLLSELNNEPTEKIDIDFDNIEFIDSFNIVEEKPYDIELLILEQDPNVQRYIELKKMQAERDAIVQGETINM